MDLTRCTLEKQGAEARLYSGIFLDQEVMVKERFSKKYRHPALDAALTKDRHRAECRALLKCKGLGVPVPTMFLCDNETNIIVMERLINTKTARHLIKKTHHFSFKEYYLMIRFRDCINKMLDEKDEASLEKIASDIGTMVAKLHAGGLIHGDITTSNIMVHAQGNLFFIDFGLSFQDGVAEDKGVDLYVLERAFISTHPNTEELFQTVLTAYTKAVGSQASEILKKFEEIRQRGRKRTMLG
ncbi:TP53-regulating kinase [Eurytemora carolleeae]|uniref:TP53-regulating kinase n=1 Tax=Eurytemora carolleeae TaxID=1294199 RepID=UPI000C75968C|nr:TP53-regulating kinase [Eurytemora carolleeae]|eukprot:XP_023343916.1 TP53-regulating kinase-like [Eurytemora affinis]